MGFQETDFQESCKARCTEWCLIQGGNVRFASVSGAHEGYLMGRVSGLAVPCEIYIYEDDAGLMLSGNDWHPCKRAEHLTDQAVMAALVDLLGKHLRRGAGQGS